MANWRAQSIRIAEGEEVEVEVFGDMIHKVRVGSIFGDDRFWMEPHQARALAAQLIAAADHAEGKA